MGSGEFEAWSEEVDRWILARVARPDGPVLILPTACAPEGDDVFDKWARMGVRHFEGMEVSAEVVPLKTREDAARPELVVRVAEGSFVYFSGGNPAYLANTLRDTPFWNEVVSRLDQGLGYAGCSAGISSLGQAAPDSSRRSFSKEVWQPGLRLFPGVSFGPHWDMTDTYMPGLRQIIEDAVPPEITLFAVDERTAACGDGTEWTVVGLGKAHIREQREWREWAAGESFDVDLHVNDAGRAFKGP
jgi:cyanophycinase-like exopeptidase